MGIERPGGPYSAEMTAAPAWPEVDETALLDAADAFDADSKAVDEQLWVFQRARSRLFDEDAWSGQAADAAHAKHRQQIDRLQSHVQGSATGAKLYRDSAAVVVHTKQQITTNVEDAQKQIAQVANHPQATAEQKDYFIKGLVKATHTENAQLVEAGAARLGKPPASPEFAPADNSTHNGVQLVGHWKEGGGDHRDGVPGPNPGDPPYATGQHPTLAGDSHDVPPMQVEHGSSDTVQLADNPPGYNGPAGPERDKAWLAYLSQQNGAATGSIPPNMLLPNPAAVSDPGLKTVGAAAKQQGVSYAWGAGHPDKAPIPGVTTGTLAGDPPGGGAHQFGDKNRIGFDCSGLARFATYEGHNGLDISAGNEGNTVGQYRTLTAQGGRGASVPDSLLRPGDLIYYGTPGDSHHVAIYAGNGLVIQAHQSGVPIEVSPMDHGEQHRNVHINN